MVRLSRQQRPLHISPGGRLRRIQIAAISQDRSPLMPGNR
jgi:hypothetical protein